MICKLSERFYKTITLKWITIVVCILILSSCASAPTQIDNVCDIFDEKRRWYKDAKKATKRWGIPIATNMAFIHQESRFDDNAKPPRKKILGFIPGPRKSSAYGYSQAKKDTWVWYQRKTNNFRADRDDFGDAIDFVAWYNHISTKQSKIPANDPYRLYLAYHEGHGGFNRGTYKNKSWLKNVAKKVERRAQTYSQQLKGCETQLNSSRWWPF